MAEKPDVECLSHDDFRRHILDRLKLLLDNLPRQLPVKTAAESDFATFLFFRIDPDLLELTGCEVSALSEQLKKVFGWNARTTGDGVVAITERGDAVCAMHKVFTDFWERHPENNVLRKWIFDVLKGVEKAYEVHNMAVPNSEFNSGAQKRDRSESAAAEVPAAKSQKKTQSYTPTSGDHFTIPKSNQGQKPDDLLAKLVIKSQGTDGKPSWSSSCMALREYDRDIYDNAHRAAVGGSLGAQIQEPDPPAGDPHPPLSSPPTTVSSGLVTAQGTLNLTTLQAEGAKSKADLYKKFQREVDHIIMQLICVRGLVPNLVDSPEWKELMHKLNGLYKPTSGDTFCDSHIPKEAAFVRNSQIDLLKKEENLTLTFDGTGERHNADWIMDKLLKTISSVGEEQWAAAVSDSTNVTKAARQQTTESVKTILDLRDCVHHIQLTIKDITALEEFKPFIRSLKGLLKYFGKSSFAVAKLREVRNLAGTDEPVNGLQKIGKTCFGTYWLACTALDPCLLFICNLVINKVIKFKNTHVQSMFANCGSDKYSSFEKHLVLYMNIVAPLIRSFWSLEAAHANTSDVFVFWLAAGATLNDLFSKDVKVTGIPRALANQVTEIYNTRYEEFFQNDLYFVAFLLDPRFSCKDFLKESVNILIRPLGPTSTLSSAQNLYPQAYEKMRTFLRNMLRPMLQVIEDLDNPNVGNWTLRDKGPKNAVSSLSEQINSFWREEYPFRVLARKNISDPLKWWMDLANHDHANVLGVLAVKIFSVLVNSMPDERTNSFITWLNSPNRGNQTTQNIVDMIQVGQWYRPKKKNSPAGSAESHYRPAVKFRKISKETLARLQTLGDNESENMELEDSDEDENADEDQTEGTSTTPRLATGQSTPTESRIAFKIDPNININSKTLLDMISETDTVSAATAKAAGAPATSKAANPEKKISVSEAFDNW
ncbi:ribonuclease H-like domain-containing protein [Crassisporium funariophilum]|nr:ribonuclease H-like domain-containing protein [Crassisporium funariophilum]